MLVLARAEAYLIALLVFVTAANVAVRAYGYARWGGADLLERSDVAWAAGSAATEGAAAREETGSDGGEPPSSPAEPPLTSEGVIDLNRATRESLMTLPGVGPVLADRILRLRAELGGFRDVAELLLVSGIGDKRFAQIRPYVTVAAAAAAEPRVTGDEPGLEPAEGAE